MDQHSRVSRSEGGEERNREEPPSTVDFTPTQEGGPARADKGTAVAPETPLGDLGGYELLAELGRGGMGIVYRARQRAADRVVALKVIRPERIECLEPQRRQEAIERFRIEAKAAARLEHDHIATVYEVGVAEGHHFYSMRYVEGPSLGQLLRHGPIESRRAAKYIRGVALALQEAHRRGILHRDLKPQNILLDSRSDRVLVTDFGLAKILEGDEGVTVTGEVFGSPPYMSPEQIRDSGSVTVASDIYGLGATLYAMLTGHPPFRGSTIADVVRQVIDEEVVPPRQRNPSVDRDLETICLKCLEKEPERRYASAQEVAEELDRYLRNEPIQARPARAPERFWRWCLRNRALAALTAGILLSLLLGSIISLVFASQAGERAEQALTNERIANAKSTEAEINADLAAENAKNAVQKASELANALSALQKKTDDLRQRELAALRNAYASGMNSAWQYYHRGNAHQVEERLADQVPRADQPDLRGFEWRLLSRATHPPVTRLRGHRSTVDCLAFSPDGRTLATGSGDYSLRLWDLPAGTQRTAFFDYAQGVFRVAFSPDGKFLVTGTRHVPPQRCEIVVRSAVGGPVVTRLLECAGHPYALAFSPDSRLLAVGTAAVDDLGKIWVYSTEDWKLQQRLEGHEKGVRGHPWGVSSLAFSPDGKRLASGSYDGTAKLWDTASWKERACLRGHTGWVDCVTFSPDGKNVATGSEDGTIRFWDVAEGRELRVLRGNLPLGVLMLTFTHGGRELVSRTLGAAALWDLATGSVQEIAGDFAVTSAAVSPDGNTLALGVSSTGALWQDGAAAALVDLRRMRLEEELAPAGAVYAIGFSNDGTKMAAGGTAGRVSIWEVASRKLLRSLEPASSPGQRVRSVQFSSDGRSLAVRTADRGRARSAVMVWDVPSGKTWLEAKSVYSEEPRAVFSPDGKWLACFRYDEKRAGRYVPDNELVRLEVWDTTTHARQISLQVPPVSPPKVFNSPTVVALSFTPDGRCVAAATRDQRLLLLDRVTGKVVLEEEYRGSAQGTTPFSTPLLGLDLLLYSEADRGRLPAEYGLTIWDLDARTRRVERRTPYTVRAPPRWLAASPDGRLLAGSVYLPDQTVLVDWLDGKEVARLGHRAEAASFSPDGKTLATVGTDRAVKLWHVATGQELAVLHRHLVPVFAAAFSPDGKLLATGGGDPLRGDGSRSVEELKLWPAPEPALPRQPIEEPARPPKMRWEEASSAHHTALVYAPDRTFWAALDDSDQVRLRDARTGADKMAVTLSKVLLPEGKAYRRVFPCGLAIAPGGKEIAIAHGTGVRIWKLRTGEVQWVVRDHAKPIAVLALDPKGQRLAFGDSAGNVKVLNWPSGSEVKALATSLADVRTIDFSPDGTWLAAGGAGKSGAGKGRVCAWATADWRDAPCGVEHPASIDQVRFSPDGRFLASASGREAGQILLHETGSWKPRFQRGAGSYLDGRWLLEFSPSSHWFLYGDTSGVVLCDLASGRFHYRQNPTHSVVSAIFLSETDLLWIGWSRDLRMKSWQTTIDDLVPPTGRLRGVSSSSIPSPAPHPSP